MSDNEYTPHGKGRSHNSSLAYKINNYQKYSDNWDLCFGKKENKEEKINKQNKQNKENKN
jgi:hypothetical protein